MHFQVFFSFSLTCIYALECLHRRYKRVNKHTVFEKLNCTNSESVLQSNTVSDITFKNPAQKKIAILDFIHLTGQLRDPSHE